LNIRFRKEEIGLASCQTRKIAAQELSAAAERKTFSGYLSVLSDSVSLGRGTEFLTELWFGFELSKNEIA